MKAANFCKQKCYFLTFFCPADDHHWCIWIYDAGVILMVIRLGSNLYKRQKSLSRGLNSYRLPIFATSVR